MKLIQRAFCDFRITALFDSNDKLYHLFVRSERRLNYGDVLVAKITAYNPVLKGYFAETERYDLPIFIPTRSKHSIGEIVCVEVTKEARLGKDATGRIVTAANKQLLEEENDAGDYVFADSAKMVNARLIEQALDPVVPFADGALLHVERTHTCWTFDVDSGKSALSLKKINKLACEVISKQILIKNLSGAILIDFAGEKKDAELEDLTFTMQQILFSDKRSVVTGITGTGLMEVCRTRTSAALADIFLRPDGRKAPGLMAIEIWDQLTHFVGGRQTLTVHPSVVSQLPDDFKVYCIIKTDPTYEVDQYTLTGGCSNAN